MCIYHPNPCPSSHPVNIVPPHPPFYNCQMRGDFVGCYNWRLSCCPFSMVLYTVSMFSDNNRSSLQNSTRREDAAQWCVSSHIRQKRSNSKCRDNQHPSFTDVVWYRAKKTFATIRGEYELIFRNI